MELTQAPRKVMTNFHPEEQPPLVPPNLEQQVANWML